MNPSRHPRMSCLFVDPPPALPSSLSNVVPGRRRHVPVRMLPLLQASFSDLIPAVLRCLCCAQRDFWPSLLGHCTSVSLLCTFQALLQFRVAADASFTNVCICWFLSGEGGIWLRVGCFEQGWKRNLPVTSWLWKGEAHVWEGKLVVPVRLILRLGQ